MKITKVGIRSACSTENDKLFMVSFRPLLSGEFHFIDNVINLRFMVMGNSDPYFTDLQI